MVAAGVLRIGVAVRSQWAELAREHDRRCPETHRAVEYVVRGDAIEPLAEHASLGRRAQSRRDRHVVDARDLHFSATDSA